MTRSQQKTSVPFPACGFRLAKVSHLANTRAGPRYWAIESLSKLPASEQVRDVLYEIMNTGADENNRETAALNLIGIGTVDKVIVATLLNAPEKDFTTYEYLGRAHRIERNPEISGFLVQQLGSIDPVIRFNSIDAIIYSEDPSFLPLLRESMQAEKDGDVRSKFEDAITLLSQDQ